MTYRFGALFGRVSRVSFAALSIGALAGGARLATAQPSAPAAPFTIEQITSYPFPSELTVAPRGSRAAWVFNERGVRNVYVAEGPGFEARKLTDFASDD